MKAGVAASIDGDNVGRKAVGVGRVLGLVASKHSARDARVASGRQ